MKYQKTKSKNFFDHEVKGVMEIDGKKVIYLETGVKRLWRYNDHLVEDHMDHINKPLVFVKKLEKYLKRVVGMDDFEKD